MNKEPKVGQSHLAVKLASAILESDVNSGELQASVDEIAKIIDQELATIRGAFKDVKLCPIITHHPAGTCSFCVAFAMREVLEIKT